MRRLFRSSLLIVIIMGLTACGTSNPPQGIASVAALSLAIQGQVPAGGFIAGQAITYQYTVANVGTTRLQGPVTVADTKVPAIFCPDVTTVGSNGDRYLDPGESLTCTGTYLLQAADVTAGSVASSATAAASGTLSNQATSLVNAPVNKVLAMTMSANPATFSQASQAISLNYTITNTGTTPLGPAQFMVNDSHVPLPIVCGAANTTLAPNAQLPCSGSYTTTAADVTAGSVVFSATASGAGAGTAAPASATITLSVTPSPNPNPNPSNYTRGSTIQYKVVKGEWLIQIARCFGVDPKALSAANPQLSDPDEISIGDVLTIPNLGSAGTLYGPPCVEFHTVQAGDTWDSIALKYNADLTVLRDANPGVSLSSASSVRVPRNSAGGTASVPVSTPSTPATTVCNQAQLVADVTVPDNTSVTAGSTFTKTWRLKNVGTCTWTSAFTLIFDHGERMNAPDSAPFTTVNIPPGSTVDLSISLKAPTVPGTYQADFRLRSAEGISFGIGSGGQNTFWVKIVVPGT